MSKRKAEEELPDEDTPTAKRAEREAAAAAAAVASAADDDPPPVDDPPAEAAQGDDPPADAPPPSHDPAYAAAAFPEPAAGSTVGVGYVMPPFPGTTNVYCFEIDPLLVGRVIGKAGETIRQLQGASGAHIDIDQNVPEGRPRKARAARGREGFVATTRRAALRPPRRPPRARTHARAAPRR